MAMVRVLDQSSPEGLLYEAHTAFADGAWLLLEPLSALRTRHDVAARNEHCVDLFLKADLTRLLIGTLLLAGGGSSTGGFFTM